MFRSAMLSLRCITGLTGWLRKLLSGNQTYLQFLYFVVGSDILYKFRHICRRAWTTWKEALEQKKLKEDQEQTALLVWANKLVAKVLKLAKGTMNCCF